MLFRRKQTPAPSLNEPEQPEAIAINLAELALLERALLEAVSLRRHWTESPAYYGMRRLTVNDVIALLYQRAGAASVLQPEPQRVRIPLYHHEFRWLTDAIATMERRWARDEHLSDARWLHNRFNTLLGQARATVHMGGVPVFTPEPPQTHEAHVIAVHEH